MSCRKLHRSTSVFCLDLESGPLPEDIIGRVDMVFSRMVNEHIKDGLRYHRNISDLLRSGGIAIHCFSTLYAMPFVVNSFMPMGLTSRLLEFFNPRDNPEEHGKFPAYYSWSRGPTKKMILGFQELRYDVLQYDGYFGHRYYSTRLPILDAGALEVSGAHAPTNAVSVFLCRGGATSEAATCARAVSLDPLSDSVLCEEPPEEA